MPAVSKKQQKAMAIAEHNPGALYSRNAGLAKMSHQQLHDFAATSTKGLPMKANGMKDKHHPSHGEWHDGAGAVAHGSSSNHEKGHPGMQSGMKAGGKLAAKIMSKDCEYR